MLPVNYSGILRRGDNLRNIWEKSGLNLLIAWLRVYPDYTLETWYSDLPLVFTIGVGYKVFRQKIKIVKTLKRRNKNVSQKKQYRKFIFITI